MASMSKQKGAAFERSMCQRLSLWVTNLTREDVYWRSAMSGGRATIKSRSRNGYAYDAQCGDITATHEAGHLLLRRFVIECKFYQDLSVDCLIFGTGKGGMLAKFWEELWDACPEGKKPFLIARQNRRPDLLCVSSTGYRLLREAHHDLRCYAHIEWIGMYILSFSEVITEINFLNDLAPLMRKK